MARSPFSIPRSWEDFVSRIGSVAAAEKERILAAPALILSASTPMGVGDDDDLEPLNTALTRKPPGLGGAATATTLVIPLLPRVVGANSQRLAVGRSTICDVQLPFADVSKVHAYVHDVTAEGCSIEDAGSTNGTYVEGKALSQGQRRVLGNGTRIVLGGVNAEFRSARGFREEVASRSRDVHQ